MLFPAQENDLFGYIDIDGKLIVPYQFRSASRFCEGLAHVIRSEGRWKASYGYLNLAGEMEIGPGPPPGYEQCGYDDFQEGRAGFWVGDSSGRGGYIDLTGRAVIPARFTSAHPFREGLASATLPNEEGRAGLTNAVRPGDGARRRGPRRAGGRPGPGGGAVRERGVGHRGDARLR